MQDLQISHADLNKLLCAKNPDAALLYLYIKGGNSPESAQEALRLTQTRYSCAAATLRQLGLWPEERKNPIAPGERPSYSEKDVLQAMDGDSSFRSLYGEIQRLLGRSLNVEELKIILGFVRYLGLSNDVISVLVCYCKEAARNRGSLRTPSLRTIEKEAYAWAEQGIDTIAAAAAFIHQRYGDDYYSGPRTYKTKAGAQDAHEAIRPTDVFLTPEEAKKDLNNDQYRLYRLIWERFTASQMANAVYDNVVTDAKCADHIFRANYSEIRFPGYTAVYEEGKDEEEGSFSQVPKGYSRFWNQQYVGFPHTLAFPWGKVARQRRDG